MKHRPLDLDLADPEMIAARARVADETAALQASTQLPTDDWERRIAQARAAVAPAEAAPASSGSERRRRLLRS